jgi:DNA polymerase-1
MLATKTLRYAYENPPLQQYPEEARHIFVAAPGKLFVSPDFAQLEARILAYQSGDTVSIQVFETGGDVHAQNARDLFGWSDEEWGSLDPDMRDKSRSYAKPFLYRISYGGSVEAGDKKLVCPCVRWGCAAKNPPVIDLKKAEAVAMERRWFTRHQPVLDFQREVANQIKRTHYYLPPLGGRRWIATPWGADLEREAKNLPIQTTAAQIMNRAQIRVHQADIPLVLQWHDQLVAEVPEAQVTSTADRMRAIMEDSVPELGGISFPVDMSIGRNLGHWSKQNPDGLKKEAA